MTFQEHLANSKEYPLVDSGKTIANSFIMDLKIYVTHIECNVWLSEIDMINGKDLKKKGKLMIYAKHNNMFSYAYITKEVLSEKQFVMDAIDSQYRKVLNTVQ